MVFKKIALWFLRGLLFSVMVSSAAECAVEGGSEAEGRKYALLIGINEYSGETFTPLKGCHNDVRLVRDLLTEDRFGFASDDVTALLDSQATHSGILNAIRALTEKARQDDIVYIHYSGHGSATPDLNGDEKLESGKDSTLVSYGSIRLRAESSDAPSANPAVEGRGAPASSKLDDYDILDDELELALANLAKKSRNVVFVADSCHSGSITRGEDAMATRGAPEDSRPHPAGFDAPEDNSAKNLFVAVGAAKDTEKAVEYRGSDDRVYGAFTWFWARALRSSSGEDTWRMVYDRASTMCQLKIYKIALQKCLCYSKYVIFYL
ncbi:MAG: caspase family protein [Synergistaceae bacterium]|jgi:hypothetical protein|nr:caspase family protein [Synergistaceae bacterium]